MKILDAVAGALLIVSAVGRSTGQEAASSVRGLSVSDYGSIQEALDANSGRMVHVPAGDY